MERFQLWDKTSSVAIMGGVTLTPAQLYAKYPHITRSSGVLLEYVSESVTGGIDSLDILKEIYGVDATLSDEDAAAQIIAIKLNPPPPESTPDERLAALEAAMLEMILGGAT